MKYKKHVAGEGGWSEWVSPTPKRPYKMACCGWWEAEPMKVAYRVLFRARRNERETAKLRTQDAAEAA